MPRPMRSAGVVTVAEAMGSMAGDIGLDVRPPAESAHPVPPEPGDLASVAAELEALFAAGPTFFSNMLRAALPGDALGTVRLATSAGEPLPAQLYHRWTGHFGVEILDGIGMTEMLHIFLSNRCGQVRPGTTGVAVPGYDLRILDEEGDPVPAGVPGPSMSGARPRRSATGRVTRPRARCSRASGCVRVTPTSRTPTASTRAWAAPGTC